MKEATEPSVIDPQRESLQNKQKALFLYNNTPDSFGLPQRKAIHHLLERFISNMKSEQFIERWVCIQQGVEVNNSKVDWADVI